MNWEKPDLMPKQQAKNLGMFIDTAARVFSSHHHISGLGRSFSSVPVMTGTTSSALSSNPWSHFMSGETCPTWVTPLVFALAATGAALVSLKQSSLPICSLSGTAIESLVWWLGDLILLTGVP